LGYYGLLSKVYQNENRRILEKILYHMNRYDFIPNDNIYELILNICDKYNYPSLLKNITDDYVINKNMVLSKNNYTWYIKILSNFKETEEYVMNLIEASFTDLKIPIRAEFYEMLFLRWILEDKLDNIKEAYEELNKRYITDFPDEEIRNQEIYKGNICLIKNFVEIFDSKNYHKTLGLPTDELDEEFEMKVESCKVELNPMINTMLKTNIEINPNYINDNKFLEICISFYAEKMENPEELISFVVDINNSELNNQNKLYFNNDLIKKVVNNFKFIDVEENETSFINYLKFFEFIYKSKFLIRGDIKADLFRSYSVKKIILFLKEYTSGSYTKLIEEIIKSGINSEILSSINASDFDNLRKLLKIVFKSDMRVNSFFNDLMVNKNKFSISY